MAAPWVFMAESSVGCVANYQSRIQLMVPNAFLRSSFINPACSHAVFERSTDQEWHNQSGTSDGRGWSVGTNLPGCWQLKNKNSLSTINNHLLFDVQTAYSSTKERQKDRQTESVGVLKRTQRDTCSPQLNRTFWMQTSHWQLTDWLTDYFSKISYFLYIWIQEWESYHLARLLCHLSSVQKSLFLFLQSNLSHKRYESILFTFWLSCVDRYILA